VIVAPAKAKPVGKSLAVAWNGGVESAHAVYAALPLLQKADRVTVLTAPTQKTDPDVQSGLVDYLGWHGVNAKAEVVEPGERAVGEALLEAANDQSCDLLIMGGYGHSRMRELIFGGVTRYALSHAEIAVLITH
jgi:nucleotide-binding universal stress UspA family protein